MKLDEILKLDDLKKITVEELDSEKAYLIYVDITGMTGDQIITEIQICMQAFKRAGVEKTVFMPLQNGKVTFDAKEIPQEQLKRLITYLQSFVKE